MMDWFERITGFRELGYAETQAKLRLEGNSLVSTVNGKSYGVGIFELVSLESLRGRVEALPRAKGQLRVSRNQADVRELHQQAEYAGALFQAASQFNCLEMISPSVTPEHGVTGYQNDRTQGPACAIAAGAATLFRNYLVPIGDQIGQTRDRQLDGLADLGQVLSDALRRPVHDLWSMTNGYALCTQFGLAAIEAYLSKLKPEQLDRLRSTLRIGLHRHVEVTDTRRTPRPFVSQAFCSALPVAYLSIPAKQWAAFAQLILDASYEATFLAAILNAQHNGSNIVVLTHLGGGAFGNHRSWIDKAIQRSLAIFANHDLDVRIVSYH